MECVHRYCSTDLFVRASAAITTSVIHDMSKTQSMGPLALMASGRAMTGAILLASNLRDGQVIGLHFRGDGPLGNVYAEATFESEARGWCDNPNADVPLRDGRIDVGSGVGSGFLNVIRSQPFEKSPHVSTVQLISGEIGEDIAEYLHQSRQVPCVIALGVVLDEHGALKASGGVLIELLPEAPDKVIASLEASVKQAKPLTQLLREGATPDQMVRNFVGAMGLNKFPHEFPMAYKCRCSMDRVERSISLLGAREIEEMVNEGKDAQIRCEFCGRGYTLTVKRLRELAGEFSTMN